MKLLFDSFWRAAAYLLMPRVIGLSLLPLFISGALCLGLGYLFWGAAVDGVRDTLASWSLIDAAFKWLEGTLGASFRSVIAPLIVVALALPVIVVLSLLLVAAFMTPALVQLVADRRFAGLARLRGGRWWQSMLLGLGWTLVALLALVVTLPLWLLPPMALLLPPLIWGWLTTKVMGFEVLAEHASVAEREALLRRHQWPLLMIGVISGLLGAAPTLIWAASAMALIFAPMLVVVSVWLYTLVFAFSGLWFAHFALAALAVHRGLAPKATPPVAEVEPVSLPATDRPAESQP